MTKVPEIILHVGLHKTATTSIQLTLAEPGNRKLLARKGFLYPQSWPENHSVVVNSVFSEQPEKYHINIRKGLNGKQVEEQNREWLDAIQREVEKKKPERLLISGEDISLLSLEGLQKLRQYLIDTFKPDVVRIIVFVRDPVALFISQIGATIRSGRNSTSKVAGRINALIVRNNKRFSPRKRIEDLESVFGENCLEVHAFERALGHGQGPVGYFLSSVIGLGDKEAGCFHIQKSNESLSQLGAEIISYINERYPIIKGGALNGPRRHRDTVALARIGGPKFDITKDQKKALRQIYWQEISWIRERFAIDYSTSAGHEKAEGYTPAISSGQLQKIKDAYIASSGFIRGLVLEYLKGMDGKVVDVGPEALRRLIGELDAIGGVDDKEDLFRRIRRLAREEGDWRSLFAQVWRIYRVEGMMGLKHRMGIVFGRGK